MIDQHREEPSSRRSHRRMLRAAAAGLLVLMLVAAGAFWQHYLRAPPAQTGLLPADMVSLQTAQGKRLLAESDARVDYPSLSAHFVGQSRRGYCGVASAVTTLNALYPAKPRWDQSTFFRSADFHVLAPLRHSVSGMSLRQFADALRAHGAHVAMTYASETEASAFRTLARRNLQSQGDYLLVNYQRAELGQEASGHISPIAAYHAGTDSVLVLDVAAHKYPPVWVPLESLWKAMQVPLNPETSRTRGFVEVSGLPRRPVYHLPRLGYKTPHEPATSDHPRLPR